MEKSNNSQRIYNLTFLAILTALVIVLQFTGVLIRFGMFSISLVLIPIVLGAAVCGWKGGAWLGLVFGAMVLASGDAAPFLAFNIPGTIITVLLKGTLCGLCAGIVFRLLEKLNEYLAVIVAAIVCPVVNTGIFLLGSFVFFYDDIATWASAEGVNTISYIFLVLIGGNFIFELIFNIVLAPIVLRLLNSLKIRKSRK